MAKEMYRRNGWWEFLGKQETLKSFREDICMFAYDVAQGATVNGKDSSFERTLTTKITKGDLLAFPHSKGKRLIVVNSGFTKTGEPMIGLFVQENAFPKKFMRAHYFITSSKICRSKICVKGTDFIPFIQETNHPSGPLPKLPLLVYEHEVQNLHTALIKDLTEQ